MGTVVAEIAALRFFFLRVMKRRDMKEDLPYPKRRRRLPVVLSPEEVQRLIAGAKNLYHRTLLLTLYGAGLRRSEVAHLKVRDIDSQRMLLRVDQGMVAQGRPAEAITYAERCRSPWASDTDIDRLCEQILLASGHSDEAYARYAISANRAATYLGWFRAVAKKYPDKPAPAVLADLVRHTPGDEGKWFAAAKDAKLFDEAVALANAAPCDPKTLTRAARDFAQDESCVCR